MNMEEMTIMCDFYFEREKGCEDTIFFGSSSYVMQTQSGQNITLNCNVTFAYAHNNNESLLLIAKPTSTSIASTNVAELIDIDKLSEVRINICTIDDQIKPKGMLLLIKRVRFMFNGSGNFIELSKKALEKCKLIRE